MKAICFKCLIVVFSFTVLSIDTAFAHTDHPIGKRLLEWQPDENISRTLVMNIDFHGGDWFVVWRKPGRVEERDGRQCVVGPYFFFDVDDQFAFDIDETVTLELLFDRSMTDGFNLSYDHTVNAATKEIRLDPAYEKRWETVTVQLDRARLANRKYEKTDFAIGALGARHPQPWDVNGEIALCGIKIIRNPSQPPQVVQDGFIELNIRNEHNLPDSVRVGLYDAEGHSPLPGDDAVTLQPFESQFKQWPMLNKIKGWTSEGRDVFYVDGSYRAKVPEGDYELFIYKGPEYRIEHKIVNIKAGQSSRLDIKLERWKNMPASGWYSGDVHVHISREDTSGNKTILAYTQAEDVHVTNLLQVSNVGTHSVYPQYAFGSDGHFIRSDHALVSGQESPRSSHRGHSIGLNANSFIWTDEDYFLYNNIADLIHKDGGLWGYAHVAIDAFNVSYGLALDVPLGVVDFLEILQMGTLNTSYLYDFLNLGYKMLPAAGSDYPFIHIAGSERTYVQLPGEFSPQAWFEAWKSGRSFVSNGPVLEFSVNGETQKSEFNIQRGQRVKISATAAVNPDMDSLSRLELVVHGKVVKTVSSDAGSESLQLDYDFQPRESLWLAIRAYGKENRVAHSAPVYVYVDGNKRFWNPELAKGIAEKYIEVLRAFKASTPNLDEDWERVNTEDALIPKWNTDKKELDRRIEQAIDTYQRLMKPGAVSGN